MKLKTIEDTFIKIGQWFKSNINGAKFKIIDITKGLKQELCKVQQSPTQQKTTYIYIQDEAGRTSYTNKQTFVHLLITPIRKVDAIVGEFEIIK